jgi:hypothetical protein
MDKASLRNVDATNADLSGASLVGAVLCSMTACHSTWRTCNFQEANLGHSVFSGAIFNGLPPLLPFCKSCAHTWVHVDHWACNLAKLQAAQRRVCAAPHKRAFPIGKLRRRLKQTGSAAPNLPASPAVELACRGALTPCVRYFLSASACSARSRAPPTFSYWLLGHIQL